MSVDLAQLEALEGLLDEALADADVAGTPGPVLAEAMVVAGRIRNKHTALDLRLAAAFDASKEWMANGSRSAPAWMMGKGNERKGTPQRRVRLGKALRAMPRVEAALVAGEITVDHVDRLAEVREQHPQAFADSERRLVGYAFTRRFVRFDRQLRYWQDVVDPDGADERAHKQTAGAHWHASKSFEDMVCANGWLDPIGGALYLKELTRLEDALFEQEWAEATARLGEGNVTAADLKRTPAQRRAAAQVLMAVRSSGQSLTGASKLQTVLNIVMDWPTFCAELARSEGRHLDFGEGHVFPGERTCRLEDGTIITPSQAISLGLVGAFRRILLDPDGVCLDYGQAQRGFTGDLRTVAMLLQEFCGHDAGCDVPSWRCEMDHLVAYTDGGPTAVVNADPKCKPHNRYKERLDAEIRRRRKKNARRQPEVNRR